MKRHGRHWPRSTLALAAFLATIHAGFPAAGQPIRFPDEFLQDAELTDVAFVDPDLGWAVGDHGAIWHTDDGGRHWRLQRSPVPCRLESVVFVDDRHGWIVGGWSHPYTHRTTGVVLHTADGGAHWERIPRVSLPRLKRVKFFDLRTGWAVGDASAMYPAGVFVTRDGGRSWSSIPTSTHRHWLTGDFLDPTVGAAGGLEGAAATVLQDGVHPAAMIDVASRHIRCLRLSFVDDPSGGHGTGAVRPRTATGWLVGDGGLVLTTTDGGRSWHEAPGRLPEGMYELFDYRAVAVWGNLCWIAGSPGTRVLHSFDGGRSWQMFDTGQRLPIRALTFLDAYRGWAVGSLGTILATRDGGRTWVTQRRGGSRVALLGIFSSADHVPLELLAKLSGNEGYLGAVELVCRQAVDAPPTDETMLEARAREAVAAVGASQADTAWGFPLRQAELAIPARAVTEQWNRIHHGQAQQRLQEYLVRKIRQWQPDVVFTEPACPRGDQPPSHLINQAVLAAVRQAADAEQHVGHLAVAGLRPWTVKKVYSYLGPEAKGSPNITCAQLAPRLGRSLAEQARHGWQLLRDAYQPAPQTCGFRVLLSRLPEGPGRRGFLDGISLAPGGDARRALSAPPPGDLRTLSRLAQQQRNIEQLLRHAAQAGAGGAQWLGQVEDLIRGLDASAAGAVLYQLADSLGRSGQPDLAAEVLEYLVRRQPNHPLCEKALVWLVQYYGSAETAWAFRTTKATAPARTDAGAPAGWPPAGGVAPASFEGMPAAPTRPAWGVHQDRHAVARGASADQRARRAAGFAQIVRSRQPMLFSDPTIRFPYAVADRRARLGQGAERYYHFLSGAPVRDAWRSCAEAERWLARPNRPAPKPVLRCVKARHRPRLDGRLDDPIWPSCEPAALLSTSRDESGWPATVMLAYDDRFLFLAATCRKAPKVAYPRTDTARPRDPNLDDRDRIELLFDVDRDYATYYRLAVDHRGWCAESCFGFSSWNPEWFVAATSDEGTWTIEAAIAWDQIGGTAPEDGSVWAVGIQRVVPGAGFQSWTRPAAVRPRPEGFGLLVFEGFDRPGFSHRSSNSRNLSFQAASSSPGGMACK